MDMGEPPRRRDIRPALVMHDDENIVTYCFY
jgi:hypothetical protein